MDPHVEPRPRAPESDRPIVLRSRHAPFTWLLVALEVCVFLSIYGSGTLPWSAASRLDETTAKEMAELGAMLPIRELGEEYWRGLSSLFLHSLALHLGSNLVGLIMIGLLYERLAGGGWYVFVFLASGFAGAFAASVAEPQSVATIGASGAVLGTGFALLSTLVRLRRRLPEHARALPLRLAVVLFLALASGFVLPLPVSNASHIGGGVAGALLGLLPLPRTGRGATRLVRAAMCAVALSAAWAPLGATLDLRLPNLFWEEPAGLRTIEELRLRVELPGGWSRVDGGGGGADRLQWLGPDGGRLEVFIHRTAAQRLLPAKLLEARTRELDASVAAGQLRRWEWISSSELSRQGPGGRMALVALEFIVDAWDLFAEPRSVVGWRIFEGSDCTVEFVVHLAGGAERSALVERILRSIEPMR